MDTIMIIFGFLPSQGQTAVVLGCLPKTIVELCKKTRFGTRKSRPKIQQTTDPDFRKEVNVLTAA